MGFPCIRSEWHEDLKVSPNIPDIFSQIFIKLGQIYFFTAFESPICAYVFQGYFYLFLGN